MIFLYIRKDLAAGQGSCRSPRKCVKFYDRRGVTHNRMKVKDYLKQLWWLDREINDKIRELDYLQAKAENCSSPELTGMPKGSGSWDRVGDTTSKLIDLQAYINQRIDQLIDLRIMIMKQIDGMDDQKHRLILSYRYLRHMRWETIEKELNFEKSYLQFMHREALKKFGEMYPDIRRM